MLVMSPCQSSGILDAAAAGRESSGGMGPNLASAAPSIPECLVSGTENAALALPGGQHQQLALAAASFGPYGLAMQQTYELDGGMQTGFGGDFDGDDGEDGETQGEGGMVGIIYARGRADQYHGVACVQPGDHALVFVLYLWPVGYMRPHSVHHKGVPFRCFRGIIHRAITAETVSSIVMVVACIYIQVSLPGFVIKLVGTDAYLIAGRAARYALTVVRRALPGHHLRSCRAIAVGLRKLKCPSGRYQHTRTPTHPCADELIGDVLKTEWQ